MAINYAAWPGATDVQARLSAAGLTLRDRTGARALAAIDEVTAEVGRTTLRQFVADGADETRTYDGSGTPELEVDEIVSLTGVTVVAFQATPNYTLDDAVLVIEQGKPCTRIIVGRGSNPAFYTDAYLLPYPFLFPAGRQNIQVMGKFGFGAQIPSDLWHAVCGEIAWRLAAECIFDPAGRVSMWKEGDEETRYQLADADTTKWHDIYAAAVGRYKRPSGRRLRNLRNRMI